MTKQEPEPFEHLTRTRSPFYRVWHLGNKCLVAYKYSVGGWGGPLQINRLEGLLGQ
jgi:hypothetical protein